MRNHTPGPWKFQRGFLSIYALDDKGTNAVAKAWHNESSDGSSVEFEEAVSNARLISAAPELLEACKDIKHELDHNPAFLPNLEMPVLLFLLEAIDKAEGDAEC